MSCQRIHLGTPALLKFHGPDALRFLNGQLTQDTQKVVESGHALPACVTDHKGKLQFRVWLHARGEAILVEAPEGQSEELEARLTRYLIADEVEVSDLSGQWQLHHLTDLDGNPPHLPEGAVTCESQRYGAAGLDCWLPAGEPIGSLAEIPLLEGDELESLRIARSLPAWGAELIEGILPPEANLDASDISYTKGCYIGQEVISRIKSAGKLNRRLTRLSFDADLPTAGLKLVSGNGKDAGELTSISPIPDAGRRLALGFLKRTAEEVSLRDARDGEHAIEIEAG
ncbi:MAG: hypothetical protein R3242_04375 [Akkermansiaceae bacterium]|nr:hypothetical protein [Akkermansiaceae bacterium]